MPMGVYPHKPHSAETRKKMSESHRGKKRSAAFCKRLSEVNRELGRHPPGQKGVRWTEERRRWWSEYQRGKKRCPHSEKTKQLLSSQRRGSKGSNWKGGVTDPNKLARRCVEFRRWREAVFVRDNFTCVKCHNRGSRLHPHHIFNFAEHLDLRHDYILTFF